MRIGQVIGKVVETDIRAFINDNPIASFNINGKTAVVAEDLSNYGFDVNWNNDKRTLTLNRNIDKAIIPSIDFEDKSNIIIGKKLYDILYSDIQVYIGNYFITKAESFNINGKTAIYIDDLKVFGNLVWDGKSREIILKFKD